MLIFLHDMLRMYKYRELIFSLAAKDLKLKYRRASGGFGWMLIMPLVQAFIFTFIFRILFKVSIENYPLFLLSGLFPWSFLRSSLERAENSILANANLIKKTPFPREILPISNIITNLISFLISLAMLFIFSLLSKNTLFPALFWLPLIVFVQVILIAGVSLFVASLNTIYRETSFIMDIILLVWFYATPIVYPLEMVKDSLSKSSFFLYRLNPLTGIIRGYQNIFFYGSTPDIMLFLPGIIVAIILFILGLFCFRHYEIIFADVV